MKVKEKIAMLQALRFKAENRIRQFHCKMVCAKLRSKEILSSNTGTGFFEDGTRTLIVVVLAALGLTFLYGLFNDTLMPALKQKVIDIYNYKG